MLRARWGILGRSSSVQYKRLMISIGNGWQLRGRVRLALSAALLVGVASAGASAAAAQHPKEPKQVTAAVVKAEQAAAPPAQTGLTPQQQGDAMARSQKIQALIGRAEN